MQIELTKEQQDELSRLQKLTNCGKEPLLCAGDFKSLPHVRQLGINGLLECKDKRAIGCRHAQSFANTHFCKCPARAYLYRKFGI